MDCYNFYQQCKDYFAIVGAMVANKIPFATSFPQDRISFLWQQYKRRDDTNSSVPVTWNKFKAFLYQSLGDSQTFVDTYWEKIKRDFQYQLEELFNWSAHLEHLQAVFQEIDPAATPNKETMIQYFWKGLRPFIWGQLDAWDLELDSWQDVVEKTVDVEDKTLLQPLLGIWEIEPKGLRGQKPIKRKANSGKKNSTDSPPADKLSGKQISSTHLTFFAQPKKDQNRGLWCRQGQK